MAKVKIGPMPLIKQFFGLSLSEAKEEAQKLSQQDKIELGSAIARERGLSPEELKFDLVDY